MSMSSTHSASDTRVSDKFSKVQQEMEVKPAMAVGHASAATQPHPGLVLPGAPPRGPREGRELAAKVDLRMTPVLREAVRARAAAEGVSDGALIRRVLADALGAEASADRESGKRPRLPPEELAVLAGVVRQLGAVWGPLSLGRISEAREGVERARTALIPLVMRLSRGVA